MFVPPFSAVKSVWILFIFLCISKNLKAQSYIADIQKLSVEDGLSSRFVNTIFKDSKGFIWIGTQYGLNRYDGYAFKTYTTENSALGSNNVKDIHEDDDQKLWVINGNAYSYQANDVYLLDLQTGLIQDFEEVFKSTAPFTVEDIRDMYSNDEKTIWISTKKGEIYRYINNHFEHIFAAPEQETLEILYASNQYLWLYGKELLKVNIQGKVLKKFPFEDPLKNVGIDNNNNLWFFQSSKKQLLQVSEGKGEIHTIPLKSLDLPENNYKLPYFRAHYMNPADGLIWWHQKDNPDFFLVFHPQKGIVYNLQDQLKRYLTYGRPQITDMYFDSGKRTWIATGDGIFIISLKKNKFTKLLSDKSKNYSIRGITEDKQGVIYINSYAGRMKVHLEKGIVKEKNKKDSLIWLGAIRDHQENLWFSDRTETIEKYNPLSEESQFYVYSGDASPYSQRLLQWVIIRDKTGRVWTGGYKGLNFLNPETGAYRKFKQYNDFSLLGESVVYHLQEDEKGIWIAASSGLYFLEPGKGITARYASEENAPYRIPYNDLRHFHRDTEGIFWLATKGGGLIRFNPKDGSHLQFTTVEGLSNNTLYAVYEDNYGKLWLSSNYGLMQFDKKSHRVNTYLTSDGIAHNEFNTSSHYQATDGKLYFGGLSGLTVFDPKDFTEEVPVSAPLQITQCQVLNNKTGLFKDRTTTVSTSRELVLSPSDKSFTIQFALLNYQNTQQNSYTYTIDGLDKAWTSISGNNLRINTLPYGNYTLRIKGQGIKGEKSKQELAIPITVIPPFYLKNGFIFSCILTLVLLVYGTFRWRLQSLEKAKIRLQETIKQRTQEIRRQKDEIEKDKNTIEQQAGKLKELDLAKSHFFANISHELRTPLTLILGHLQAALKQRYGKIGKHLQTNLEVSRQNSHRLLKMIEEILDLSKMEAGKLELHNKPVMFYALIERICDTFQSYATGKNIQFKKHIAIAPDLLLMLDEEKFEKIITNLLSNAFKFTKTGGVISVNAEEVSPTINMGNKENLIRLIVRDSGKGIHPDNLPYIFDRFYQGSDKDTPMEGGTGIGLALAKELAELLGGHLNVKSKLGEGSVFTFIFPKKQTILSPQETDIMEKTKPLFPDSGLEKQEKITVHYKKPIHTILIVEDHKEMRSYIRQQIIGNYYILEAADGLEALDILKKQPVDLILSDVMMPRMDGFQLLKKLRSNPATEDIAVIMLTARAAQEDRMHALTIGVDDYLTKPFHEEELMARIKHSLKNQAKRQHWSAQLPETEKKAITTDKQFISRAETTVIKAISNHEYAVIDLAEDLNLSQRQLFRKIKAITGLSPLQFIHEIRLQKARSLLENKETETVAEVMYAVGFRKSSHFAQVYSKRFGKLPSSYFS